MSSGAIAAHDFCLDPGPIEALELIYCFHVARISFGWLQKLVKV